MRGYNLSEKPTGVQNYNLNTLVEDIRGLSEALNLERFNLTGHDWGGVIAWAFAEKFPEKLENNLKCTTSYNLPSYNLPSFELLNVVDTMIFAFIINKF